MVPSDALDVRLEKVLAGELGREQVLDPLLEGLEEVLSQFEAALEHQPDELLELLGPLLDNISDGAEGLRESALDALDHPSDNDLLFEVATTHRQLNELLMEFHRQSWIFIGPTEVDWINRAVKAVDTYLTGGNIDSRLGPILDDQIRALEVRLVSIPAQSGQQLLKAGRELSRWTRGLDSFRADQLEEWKTLLVSSTKDCPQELFKPKLHLEQIVAALENDPDPETEVYVLESAFERLRQLRNLVTGKNESVRLVLEAMELAFSELNQPHPDRESIFDRLGELSEDLRGCLEKADSKTSDEPRIDYGESGGGEQEELHLVQLRVTSQRYQDGLCELDDFRQEVLQFRERLKLVANSPLFKNATNKNAPTGGREFVDALALIEHGLNQMFAAEVPQDQGIPSGLAGVSQGAKVLRSLTSG